MSDDEEVVFPDEAQVFPELSEYLRRYGRVDQVQVSPTGGLKDNLDKPAVELLPSKALLAVAEVIGFGARKYAPHNWRRGVSWTQTLGSAQRHLLAWNDGEDLDPETGYTHLAHAATQIMFLIEFTMTSTGVDDRFSTVGHEGGDSSRGDPSRESV